MSSSNGCNQSYEWIRTCRLCGAEYDLSNYDFSSPLTCLMHQDQLCHECAYWKDLFIRNKGRIEIVDGHVFTYGEEYFTYQIDGRKSHALYVQRPDGTMVRMDFAFCHGTMPERVRKEHPDTGVFIKGEAYRRISKHTGRMCRARGCYDRYHCLWYDLSLEKDGPWNVIPESHQTGDENCMSFVDKADMYNVEVNYDNRSRF